MPPELPVSQAERPARAEAAAAAKFVAGLLSRWLHSSDVEAFTSALAGGIERRMAGHWHNDSPTVGQGYRCLRWEALNHCPVIASALSETLRPLARRTAAAALPHGFCVWVDPGEVSIAVGDHGVPTTIFGGVTTTQGVMAVPVSPTTSTAAAAVAAVGQADRFSRGAVAAPDPMSPNAGHHHRERSLSPSGRKKSLSPSARAFAPSSANSCPNRPARAPQPQAIAVVVMAPTLPSGLPEHNGNRRSSRRNKCVSSWRQNNTGYTPAPVGVAA